MAVLGAPALPGLPEEASTFEASFRHSILRWKSKLKSLKGSMSKVGTGRAGAPKFSSPMTPAEQAARLGLEWPRTGEDRCRLCPTCLAGGCKRQGCTETCLGCQQKKRCDILTCTKSYLKAPSVTNSETPPGGGNLDNPVRKNLPATPVGGGVRRHIQAIHRQPVQPGPGA